MSRTYRDLTFDEMWAVVSAPAEAPRALARRLGLSPSTVGTVRKNHAGQNESAIRAHIDERRQYDRIWRIVFDEAKARGPNEAGEYTFATQDQRRAQTAIGNTGNTYDLKYNLQGRGMLPEDIQTEAPLGKAWHIHTLGKGRYAFRLLPVGEDRIHPAPGLAVIEIPNALPLLVERHSRRDEQALLARIRYNNLVGVFLGLSVYSLQSHWKTSIKGTGIPTEIDEVYVGLNAEGEQFAICVEAKSKSPKETVSAAQILGNYAAAKHQFATLPIISIAAKALDDTTIAMLLLEVDAAEGTVAKTMERHYRVVG